MMDQEDSIPIVPVAVSTAQTENEFTFDKFDTKIKDRQFYLGEYDENDYNILSDKITQYYSLPKLIRYLKDNNTKFHNITLQFPDSLIMDSSIIVNVLQKHFPSAQFHKENIGLGVSDPVDSNGSPIRRFWILADTAYSACCVDEIAAEHVNSDLVVHFGDACLNAIQKLPVVYIFGQPRLDCDKLIKQFLDRYPNKDAKICLMSNAPYTIHLAKIYNTLVNLGYLNIVYTQINKDMAGSNAVIMDSSNINSDNVNDFEVKEVYTLGNRKLYGKCNIIEDPAELQSSFELFYITIPQDPHLLYLTTTFNTVTLYDVENNSIIDSAFPSLMKRYRFMNVARTAGCIGILINTLSLRNTKETINKLIKLVRSNAKKHYLFVVGKPNIAKLANFEPVDIWCILGCGQGGIIIDQFNEFYKPIITPYELTLALNKEIIWTGKWVTDFENALQGLTIEDDQNNSDIAPDSDAPEFDVVTGKFVSTSRPLRELKHLELESPLNDSGDLVKSIRGGAVIKGTVSTSATNLQNRYWSGLGSDFKNDEDYDEDGAIVEEGIIGVARGYQFDRRDAIEKNQQ
ncbi:2-(3-amino-3-carboxypropyl)histidine synthase PWA37_003195 [Arxiozyma heterogenica]